MRRLLVLLICLLIATAVYADYPLSDLTPITVENAADLQHLASVGGDLPGQLAWSPDGKWLAAGMTSAVKIYAADDLNAPSLVLEGGIDALFDPTSQRLVSGGRLWDVQSGQALADLDAYNSYSTFSPSGDILATGQQIDSKTVVSLWSSDGERLIDLNTDSDSIFSGAVFNVAENQIALLLENVNPFRESPFGVVQVWDVTSGQQMAALESGFEDLMKVQFVVDDRMLLVQSMSSAIYGGPLGDIRLWDIQTGELVDQWNDVYFPVISPDGNMMIEGNMYCCEGRELQVFYLARSTAQSFGSSSQPAFSPDGHYFAVVEGRAGSRGKLPAKQTEAESHILLRPFNDEGFFSEPSIRIPLYTYLDNMYRFSPDSRFLGVHIRDGIEIWDLGTQTIQQTIETLPFYDFTFNADGRFIVTFSGDRQYGSALLYDIASGQALGTLPTSSIRNPQLTQSAYWENGDVHVGNGVSSTDTVLPTIPGFIGRPTVIDPVGGRAIFKGENLHLYDLLSGRPMTRFNGVEAAFTPDGQRLLTETDSVTVRDLSALGSNPVIVNDVRAYVRGSALNADGSLMTFSEWQEGKLHLFNLQTGSEVAAWNPPGERPLTEAFSPTGHVLAVASHEGRSVDGSMLISLWDVDEAFRLGGGENMKPLAMFSTWGAISGSVWIRFSPDGERMAVLTDYREMGDGPSAAFYRLILLEVDEMIQRGGTMGESDLNPVVIEGMYQPQFSPDGRYLLTTQYAGIWDEASTIILWDVETGMQIAAVAGGEESAFSPDGSLFATEQPEGIALYAVTAVVAGETEPITVLPYLNNLYEIVFSADSTLLFARTIRTVELWAVPG